METSGFLSLFSLTVKPIRSLQRFIFINMNVGIEMGKPFDSLQVIQYCVPAEHRTLVQGFLIIVYGSEGKQIIQLPR
jgi:hypothetical protein